MSENHRERFQPKRLRQVDSNTQSIISPTPDDMATMLEKESSKSRPNDMEGATSVEENLNDVRRMADDEADSKADGGDTLITVRQKETQREESENNFEKTSAGEESPAWVDTLSDDDDDQSEYVVVAHRQLHTISESSQEDFHPENYERTDYVIMEGIHQFLYGENVSPNVTESLLSTIKDRTMSNRDVVEAMADEIALDRPTFRSLKQMVSMTKEATSEESGFDIDPQSPRRRVHSIAAPPGPGEGGKTMSGGQEASGPRRTSIEEVARGGGGGGGGGSRKSSSDSRSDPPAGAAFPSAAVLATMAARWLRRHREKYAKQEVVFEATKEHGDECETPAAKERTFGPLSYLDTIDQLIKYQTREDKLTKPRHLRNTSCPLRRPSKGEGRGGRQSGSGRKNSWRRAELGGDSGDAKTVSRTTSSSKEECKEYLARHNIHELFTALTSDLLQEFPEDPLTFLITLTHHMARQYDVLLHQAGRQQERS